ncbi:PREDICTED: histone-lysine N-methyltransferase SETMAR-like [Dufourea novaeangliae]|nr:PREDICTED: histone-lysine N-methyltransferase SETMAR-like [Dufourea novaeangliae]
MADEEHIRHCMLYEFQLGRKANEAAKHICSAFGQDTVGVRKCQQQIVTGDEKWVLYVNLKRRPQWLDKSEAPQPTPKPDLHAKKVMLCVWWNFKGILHYELLPTNQTITSEVYSAQLERLDRALREKEPALINRKGVILHHDNARSHTARITAKKLRQLGWEVLPQPAYSPDIGPSDYHLFRSLQNFLLGKHFNNEECLKNALTEFFESKSQEFYNRGIKILPERWAQVVENNGNYIVH